MLSLRRLHFLVLLGVEIKMSTHWLMSDLVVQTFIKTFSVVFFFVVVCFRAQRLIKCGDCADFSLLIFIPVHTFLT